MGADPSLFRLRLLDVRNEFILSENRASRRRYAIAMTITHSPPPTSPSLSKETVVRFLQAEGGSSHCNFSSSCFHGIELMNLSLSGANLSHADMSQANLCGINLCRANLSGADLHATALCWAQLRHANLEKADLHGADLTWADLHGANLQGSRLDGALLSGADLSYADLHGVCLDQRDLLSQSQGTSIHDEARRLYLLKQRLRCRGAIFHEPCAIQVVDPPNDARTSFRWGFVFGVLLMSIVSFIEMCKRRSTRAV